MEQKTNNKKYKYYEVKVSVKDTHPLVWRRLQIPEGITFHQLSAIIQLAFGWSGYHAYDFEIGSAQQKNEIYIELPDLDGGWGNYEVKNSKKEKIDQYFLKYKKMRYVYDFGDNWIHDITIEKIVETDKKLTRPICIKAKMANLPEDCGGPYGYEELLEILANKEDKRYKEMKEWLEETCFEWPDDRENVDMEEINTMLDSYKEHAKFLLEGGF